MRFPIRNKFAAILAILLLLAVSVYAAAPGLVSYQGRLTDGAGLPLNGNYSLTFSIYGSVAGGVPLWTETQNPVVVVEGLFNVLLGSASPLNESLFSGANRYIGVQVNGGAELAPRRQIVTVAYAFAAIEADSTTWSGIKGIPAGFADGVDDVGAGGGGDITAVNTSGGLTGGATTGEANISIAGSGVTSTHIGDGQILNADINAAANIDATKILGTSAILSGLNEFTNTNTFSSSVILGDSTFRADSNGIMIGRNLAPSSVYLMQFRRNYAATATRYGIYTSLENSSTGTLVGSYSRAVASTTGESNSGTVYGSYSVGESDSDARYGSYSNCSARNSSIQTGSSYGSYSIGSDGEHAYGHFGRAVSSRNGYGVYGEATLVSQYAYGVYGRVADNSSDAFGVYGYATNTTSEGYGVVGIASGGSDDGTGVYGSASSNAGSGFGIFGAASGNGDNWAGYFSGNVHVTGNVTMPAKTTEIDHPLDPENQTLSLAGVDSPEMKAIYDGTISTDANGGATVVLPAYFDRLLTNFRYQLTVIGEFSQAIVARKIENGRFIIKTEKPNIEVCWQVTGTRNDAYAVANPLQVEKAKRREERGFYLHPTAFGISIDRGVAVIREPNRGTDTPTPPSRSEPELPE